MPPPIPDFTGKSMPVEHRTWAVVIPASGRVSRETMAVKTSEPVKHTRPLLVATKVADLLQTTAIDPRDIRIVIQLRLSYAEGSERPEQNFIGADDRAKRKRIRQHAMISCSPKPGRAHFVR